MHVIAAKAVAFKEALSESFKAYQKDTVKNAQALSAHLMNSGIKLVSDGTDNHLMIVDLRNLKITGKDAEDALGRAGITVNKNSIPFEMLSPALTSGIRIGTPAITTRGMKVPEMETIAELIVRVLQNHTDDKIISTTKKKVFELCEAFPLYFNWQKEVG